LFPRPLTRAIKVEIIPPEEIAATLTAMFTANDRYAFR